MSKEKMITERWLDKHNACSSGMNWFRSRFPNGAEISKVMVGIVCDQAADGSWLQWLISRAKHTDASWALGLPESVGGSLYLRGCTFLEGFKLPDSVGGWLDLSGCTFLEGFKLPEKLKNKVVR